MANKLKISPRTKKLVIYILLVVAAFTVFGQVRKYDFISFDDFIYVTENIHVQSGPTLEGFRWAFSTKETGLWNPLVWISFMLDHRFFGLNAGGYHITNLILHMLSSLLLFWLFCRMTGDIWKSAFVAVLFVFHPLHVESVVWIAERKDVLSAFFWMVTLCCYVYYTEKPVAGRYVLVLISFVLALMSKPMVVTLPLIMILLDYWPLKRFESGKGNMILWQLKEKTLFFILSAVLVHGILWNTNKSSAQPFPLGDRIANALVSFVTYIEKTFWPHDMAVFYPFSGQIPNGRVIGASLFILVITVFVVVTRKSLPHIFTGWLWYVITILPVIGIIQISISTPYAMADRYHYLSSIGLAVVVAWGIPSLIRSEGIRTKIIVPAAIAFSAIMGVFAWQQCGYWKDSMTLFSHTLQVTGDNFLAHHNRGYAYEKIGNYQNAIEEYSEAIRLKPDYTEAYNNRGVTYAKLGQYQLSLENFNQAIRLKPAYASAYNNRGVAFAKLGQYQLALENFNQAIRLKPDYAEAYNNRGDNYAQLGQYQLALEDFNRTIQLNPFFATAYSNRGAVFFLRDNDAQGCLDAQKACTFGLCKLLKVAKNKKICR